MTQQQKAIVIGAGIVGMATARALALKGLKWKYSKGMNAL
ncbi:FAD-dependent oxidoreductase [Chitinophaga pinensis]|nr:FAD-dependent oxidoreductase [Chitinophaga pinensis]